MPKTALVNRPIGGWLAVWRACANANIVSLTQTRSLPAMSGFSFFPCESVQPTPARQLADVGVLVDPPRLDLRFNPSWVEVQFNPQWIRNMFL